MQENYVDAEKTRRKVRAYERKPAEYIFESYKQEIRSIGEIPDWTTEMQYSGENDDEKL